MDSVIEFLAPFYMYSTFLALVQLATKNKIADFAAMDETMLRMI